VKILLFKVLYTCTNNIVFPEVLKYMRSGAFDAACFKEFTTEISFTFILVTLFWWRWHRFYAYFLGETSGRLKLFSIKGWLLRLHSWTVCVWESSCGAIRFMA